MSWKKSHYPDPKSMKQIGPLLILIRVIISWIRQAKSGFVFTTKTNADRHLHTIIHLQHWDVWIGHGNFPVLARGKVQMISRLFCTVTLSQDEPALQAAAHSRITGQILDPICPFQHSWWRFRLEVTLSQFYKIILMVTIESEPPRSRIIKSYLEYQTFDIYNNWRGARARALAKWKASPTGCCVLVQLRLKATVNVRLSSRSRCKV